MFTSKELLTLRKWNKKTAKKRKIRVGTVVSAKRGIGIVTYRDKNLTVVAHESDSWLCCHTYRYDIDDVELSYEHIDPESKLYMGAWKNIISSAIQRNADYEIARNKAIVHLYADSVGGKKESRTFDTDFGSHTYTRFIGDGFDFEINTRKPFLTDGDKVLYALGYGSIISDVNGHGWIYTRKVKNEDINHGKCKYVFNVDDEGIKDYS